MVAFLDCLNQLGDYASKNDPNFRFPYRLGLSSVSKMKDSLITLSLIHFPFISFSFSSFFLVLLFCCFLVFFFLDSKGLKETRSEVYPSNLSLMTPNGRNL